MPFDSNGNASLTPGYLAVTGQAILASQHNPVLEDIASMLSQVLLRSGVAPMNAALNMNGFKITNLANGTADSDAVNYGQLQDIIAEVAAATIPTGMRGSFFRQTAPSGWIIGDGGNIGNAASGATTRANADTEDLFTLLWGNFSNTLLPIFNSDGSVSSRGASAAVDFAANKRLRVFDLRTRYDRGADKSRGFDTSLAVGVTHADSVGPHAHTLARNSADPTGTDQVHSTTGGVDLSISTSSTSASIGTETAPRTVVSLHCIKL